MELSIIVIGGLNTDIVAIGATGTVIAVDEKRSLSPGPYPVRVMMDSPKRERAFEYDELTAI